MAEINLTAAWQQFEDALGQLCNAWNGGHFAPLLESDIVGYLYYLLLVRSGGDASCWHLDTRLRGAEANEKFDLVFGPVVWGEQQRSELLERLGASLSEHQRKLIGSKMFLNGLRPVVEGSLIVEVKLFATGFTPQQHNVHLLQALEDIARLGSLCQLCPHGRAVLLVDADSYLKAERRKRIIEARGQTDLALRIYVCDGRKAGQAAWQRIGVAV